MPKALPVKLLHPHQEGLSLLEVMVAIAVVTIAVTALVTISNAAMNSVDSSRNQAIADQYARQTLEATRVNRDQRGWNAFLTASNPTPTTMSIGDYWVYSLNGTVMTYQQKLTGSQITADRCTGAQSSTYQIAGTTNFYRLVTLYYKDASTVQVTATVCYAYRNNTNRKIEVQTLLTNWQ